MIYVAMFDEVNEGTAIFKVSDNLPVSDVAKFADIEGVPSDWYLWLTGEAGYYSGLFKSGKSRYKFTSHKRRS